jgi:hypothetical protein
MERVSLHQDSRFFPAGSMRKQAAEPGSTVRRPRALMGLLIPDSADALPGKMGVQEKGVSA